MRTVAAATIALFTVAILAGCGGDNQPVNGRAAMGTAGMTQLGPGMMGYEAAGRPVRTLEAAREQAGRFGARLGLHAGEVMEFTNGYYAELRDDRGANATEVLVDSSTGTVWIEYGPAMMWNTRYGMPAGYRMQNGGGMMGGGMGWGMGNRLHGDPTWTPYGQGVANVSVGEAERIAERWLKQNRIGLQAGEAEAFPGYYTLHTEHDGKVAGMLSVNASTGAVWYHWWHGRFQRMAE
jgi:hypothetical protein